MPDPPSDGRIGLVYVNEAGRYAAWKSPDGLAGVRFSDAGVLCAFKPEAALLMADCKFLVELAAHEIIARPGVPPLFRAWAASTLHANDAGALEYIWCPSQGLPDAPPTSCDGAARFGGH